MFIEVTMLVDGGASRQKVIVNTQHIIRAGVFISQSPPLTGTGLVLIPNNMLLICESYDEFRYLIGRELNSRSAEDTKHENKNN